MVDGQSDDDGLDRRSLLKSTAVLGAVPFATKTVGATPAEASVDVDEALRQPSVRKLVSEIPDVEFDTATATVFGAESSVVAVPANYGKLVVEAPSTVGDEASASFYFNRHVPGVRANWPEGTTARLTATSNGTQFERATTDREKRAILEELGRSEFGLDGTSVSVSPDRERVSLMHVDRTARVMKTVDATGSITTDGRVSSLEVVDETTYTESHLRSEVFPQAECSGDIMIDLVWCIIDYSDCTFCWIGSPAPPVFAACIVIVCFDGGLALLLEVLMDHGCSAAAIGGVDCLQQLIDQYGDKIPV